MSSFTITFNGKRREYTTFRKVSVFWKKVWVPIVLGAGMFSRHVNLSKTSGPVKMNNFPDQFLFINTPS